MCTAVPVSHLPVAAICIHASRNDGLQECMHPQHVPMLTVGMIADWGRRQATTAHNVGSHGLCLLSCAAIR